jgi:DNA-binding transcriptional MerR regulator
MDAQTCTHRDLAQALGVSETTIKSYRAKFPTFLPVAREGKPVRLHAEALDVCRRIRQLFADGLSIVQAVQALRSEFKEYPLNRRLSTTSRPAVLEAPGEPDAGLAAQLRALAEAQEAARERMEQLEAEVRNLATLEAASKSLVAELLEELRAARHTAAPQAAPSAPAPSAPAPAAPVPPAEPRAAEPVPASTRPDRLDQTMQTSEEVMTARKIVTVHGRNGAVASYALGREPKPEPPFAAPALPPDSFIDMPVVIRSDRGDFLGLPGGQSVRRLVDTLSTEQAPSWYAEGHDAWACAIPLGRAQTREIVFEGTTTPRGNRVGLIRRMRINEAEATPAQLQDIFRQLRDQMA